MERNRSFFFICSLCSVLLSFGMQAQCDYGGNLTEIPKGWILNNQSAIREVAATQDVEIALILYKNVSYRFQIQGDSISGQEFEVYIKTTLPAEEGKEEHHSEKEILLSNKEEMDGDFVIKNEVELRVFVRLKATQSENTEPVCRGLRLLEKI